ncbi:MAG: uroporphyrinogen decarboxylase family protein [Promethearchaeota archaeon]
MNAKERVLKTINHEEPDRVPTFEISIDNLTIYNHFGLKYGYQGSGALLKALYYLLLGNKKLLTKLATKLSKVVDTVKPGLDLYKKIGIDLSCIWLGYLPIFFQKEGIIDDTGRILHFKKNPSDNMDVLYYIGGSFKSFEDYEAFPPLDPDSSIRKEFFDVAKEMERQSNGEIYIMPAIFGLMESTWQAFGMENFSRLLTHPKQIKKVFDDRGKFGVEMVKRIIDWGETGPVLIGDDYGYKNGLLMSPRNYQKYVLPWIKRICNTAHKGGLKVVLHSCGDIYKLFENIIECGVDAIHPLEPTTANPEYDIFKLNRKYGDKITFVGNVSPQDLADKEPEYISNHVKKLIKEIAPGGGFILSSGHSINPAVKLKNFLAMQEMVKKYGEYPININ